MEMQAANRRYDDLHGEDSGAVYHDGTFESWSADPSESHPYHFRDGVSIWVSPVDLSPDDDFLSSKNAPGVVRGGEHGNEA